MLGEDVEDQHGAVDHLGVDQLLQVPELPRGQLVVHDHGVGPERLDGAGQLLGLALADEGAGVGPGPPLDHGVQHLGPGGLGQPVELLDRALGALDRPVDGHADEHHPFELQLAQLDELDFLGRAGRGGGRRPAVGAAAVGHCVLSHPIHRSGSPGIRPAISWARRSTAPFGTVAATHRPRSAYRPTSALRTRSQPSSRRLSGMVMDRRM